MPRLVGIEITRRCNFRCAHCFVDAGQPRAREATRTQWQHVLNECAATGTQAVAFSGGEPLVSNDLIPLIAHARALGLRTSVVSNGYLATRWQLQALQQAGLQTIQISLDGPDASRAERFRKGPSDAFTRAVDALRDSVALGLDTHICSLLAPETAPDIDAMLELAQTLGVPNLRYTVWAPVGRAAGTAYDERHWQTDAMTHFLQRAAEHRAQGLVRITLDCPTGPLPFRLALGCAAGRELAYVTAEGDVYPCTALLFPTYRVGNLFTEGVASVWQAPTLLKLERQRRRLQPSGSCKTCGLVEHCRGGCAGRIMAAYGTLHGKPQGAVMPVCLYRLFTPPTSPG